MLDDCFQVSQRLTSDPTTTPQQCHNEFDNAANQADQRSARRVRSWLQECKMNPPLRGNKGKKHTTSLRLCNIKLDYTSRLMGIDTAQGHANSLCIVPKTLTETSREKREKDTEMLRATCSADFHRCRPDSNDTKDTRLSAGSRRKTYRDQEKRVFSSKTANHV